MSEDEFIQNQIEYGGPSKGIDAEAYQTVFRALKKEPALKLRSDFAEHVASIAFAPKKSFDWDRFFLISGLCIFIMVMIYAIAVTEFTFSLGAFQFLKDYSFLFVFALAFITMLQWIDRKIVKTV